MTIGPFLSRRELFAVKAMQALLSNPTGIDWKNSQASPVGQILAKQAVRYADALIKELDNEANLAEDKETA